MKYLYNSLLLVFTICNFSNAQTQTDIIPKGIINPSYGLNGGDVLAAPVALTHDNYTCVAGSFDNTIDFDLTQDTFTITSTYRFNIFIAKYDKQSHLIFAFKLSGLSGEDNITSVTTDKDDNIYVAGVFAGKLDFDPGINEAYLNTGSVYYTNAFFAKYNKNGKFILAKQITSINDDRPAEITSIKTDEASNIFITGDGKSQDLDFDPGIGVAHPESHGKADAFFAKYDSSGNYIYVKSVGSSADDICSGFTFNKNKDIIITGSFGSSNNDFDPNQNKIKLTYNGGNDAFVGIYDSLGNFKYAFSIGGLRDDAGYGITTDNNSDIIVTGSFYGTVDFAPDSSIVTNSSNQDADYFLAKYSAMGKLIFVTTIRAAKSIYSSVAIDQNNNIYVSGDYTNSVSFISSENIISKGGYDVFWAKYNSDGTYIFSKSIGGINDDIEKGIIVTSNSQLFVVGNFSGTIYFDTDTTKQLTTLNQNFYIAVYKASSGNSISQNTFGTYREFYLESTIVKMTHDSDGNTYITGNFQGLIDFDPGIGTYYLESYQDASKRSINSLLYDDMFFAKYDAKGNLVFAKALTATGGVAANSIMIDNNRNIYLTGKYYGTIDMDPGKGAAILHGNTNTSLYRSCFISKYDSLGNYVFAKPLYISGEISASAIDKKNNVYITGSFGFGYFDPDNDTSRISVDGDYAYFAKYNSAGKFLYLKSMGQKNKNTFCNYISVNGNNNIVIAGNFSGSMVDFDPGLQTHYANSGLGYAHFIAAYSAAGNFLFEDNSACLSANSFSLPTTFAIDKKNNIIVTGPFSGSLLYNLKKDTLYSVETGIGKAFLIKYNSNGKILFLKTISNYDVGGTFFSSLAPSTSTTDDKNNFYLSGAFQGKIDFDLSTDTAFVYADTSMHSGRNIYLAKYDSSGNYQYAYNFAPKDSVFGSGAETPDIFINKNNDITWAVSANGKIDFYPGPDTLFYYPPFNGYQTFQYNYSFVLVKFKQTQTVKPFTIYASTLKPDIDKIKTFSLNKLAKYLK